MSYYEDKSTLQPAQRSGVFSTRLPRKIYYGRKSLNLELLNPVASASDFRRLPFRKRYTLLISPNWLKFDPYEAAEKWNIIFTTKRSKSKPTYGTDNFN